MATPERSLEPAASPVAGSEGWRGRDLWIWSFLAALLRQRYLVVGVTAACVLAVVTLVLLTPRSYVASASFVPQEPATPQGGLGQLAAQFGIGVSRTSSGSPQFYADLLQSREILRDVALAEYSTPGFKGSLVDYYRLSGKPDRFALQRTLRELREHLSVSAERTTGIVRFRVDTTDPELSVAVVRRLLDLVNDYNLRRLQTQARAEREFVEQRLEAARQALAQAEQALVQFHQTNRRFEESPQLVAREARLQRQVNLRQEMFLSLSQNFEAARIDEVRSTPLITVLERPEGFVEPERRGLIVKTLAALFVGLLLGVTLALVREYLRQARQGPSDDFREVAVLWRQTVSDLRGGFLRRAG